MIAVHTLVAAGVPPTQARLFAEPLAAACRRFEIDSPARVAAFVGQCAVESNYFSRLEENLNYSTPQRIRQVWPSRVPSIAEAQRLVMKPEALANRVYANRLGNGSESSGDGWRFRGRGIVQLTGRSNYAEATTVCARPYVDQPGLVAQPLDASFTAAFYWHRRGLNELADAWAIGEITRAINGPAALQADLRAQISDAARRAFA